MTNFVVTGFSSFDYALRLDRHMVADKTTTIRWRPNEWPRVGGPPAFIATAMVQAGFAEPKPISWVGPDHESDDFLDRLTAAGVPIDGIQHQPGRMPTTVLAYEPDGGCHCLYDPGLEGVSDLDDHQRALVAAADWVCLTVGPPEATEQILALIRPEAKLVWSVKVDERVMPGDLAARVAARADIAAWSRAEAQFATRAFGGSSIGRQDRLLIETRGGDGIVLSQAGNETRFAVDPIETSDTTGAGDTFLGGFLAALIPHPETPHAAIRCGIRSVEAMLLSRLDKTRQSHPRKARAHD